MIHWFVRLPLFLGALSGCSDKEEPSTTEMVEGPEIEHEPPENTLYSGDSVELTATVNDPDGVDTVKVYYRTTGSDFWEALDLTEADGAWAGTVDNLAAPGCDYYLKATDHGEVPASTHYPTDGTTAPIALTVRPETQDLPFVEGFETGGDTADTGFDGQTLYDLGWWTPSTGFTGYEWDRTASAAASGQASAFHSRSSAEANVVQDWLISPALDLSSLGSNAMVQWHEKGSNTSAIGVHALYISTSTRNPDEGGYSLITDALSAPGSDWAPSDAVDLRAYQDEPVAYLAWYYEGQGGDDWYIDDIEVGPLAADLDASLSWSPDPVHPGETATLTITLDNNTDADASGLSATMDLPEKGGTFSEGTISVDDIPGQTSGTVDFELVLDADLDDNRTLPLTLDVTDGDREWTWDLEMLVGEPSEGSVSLTLDESAAVVVVIGVGDPEDPSWSKTAWTGVLTEGEQEISTDLTDAYVWFPPEPGPLRWFASVTATAGGSTTAFDITTDGQTHTATYFSDFEAEETSIIYLPEPPDPAVSSWSPTEVVPGDSDQSLVVSLINNGADTSGPVTATVTSNQPDLTITSGSVVTLTTGSWDDGDTAILVGTTFSVSSDHTDSLPLTIDIELDDGLESWEVEVEIEVPWPVILISGIEIDDSGGDGLLDADEFAELEIVISNTGDLATNGSLIAELSIADTSTAAATIESSSGWYFALDPSESDDDDFELTVTSGAAGDTLDLVLTLDDGDEQYEATAQLVLGEPPWFTLSSADDAVGDVLDKDELDILRAQWRQHEGTIQLIVEASGSVDVSSIFLEFWGVSSSADYTYYRWVVQSGSGDLQGYTSGVGFLNIGDLEVEALSETKVLLSWSVEDMGLSTQSVDIGLASGWCGPPAYFCDHYPDGWGYPYDTFSTATWFEMSW